MIIAFEGIDGSYKSTNAKSFADWLGTMFNPQDISLASFPSHGHQSAYFVDSLLNGSYEDSNINPSTIFMMFAMDHWDHWTRCRKFIDEHPDHIYVCDRSIVSNFTYQIANEILANRDNIADECIITSCIKSFKNILSSCNLVDLKYPNFIFLMNPSDKLIEVRKIQNPDEFEKNQSLQMKCREIYPMVINALGIKYRVIDIELYMTTEDVIRLIQQKIAFSGLH